MSNFVSSVMKHTRKLYFHTFIFHVSSVHPCPWVVSQLIAINSVFLQLMATFSSRYSLRFPAIFFESAFNAILSSHLISLRSCPPIITTVRASSFLSLVSLQNLNKAGGKMYICFQPYFCVLQLFFYPYAGVLEFQLSS